MISPIVSFIKEKRAYAIGIFVIWSVGMVFAGMFLPKFISQLYVSDSGNVELRGGGTGFTNPLLECDFGSDSISSRKEDFTPDAASFVDALKQKPGVTEIAMYYRDLNNGPVIGIDQNTSFAPASLLKVPIMMSYFSRAESDPSVLSRQIVFSNERHALPQEQRFPSQDPIVRGTTYSTETLIEHMIKYSDNNAMALLYDQMPVEEQENLYKLLGVDSSIITDASAELTVRQYSIFFRILYNASFLSRTHSEQALKLLSETTFNGGLRAGVPASIVISHKFGERKFSDVLQQFHDCGIVYYPNHPYLLCVMTRGNTTEVLTQAIADISRFVYDKIDAQYGKGD